MTKEIKVGDAAPDFRLKDHHGKERALSDMKGRKVVLGFHPLAWTRACALQMKDLEANADKMAGLGAAAFGLSVDSTFCKKAWAESLGIEKTPLLSDFWPHGGVASDYGVFREVEGTSQRAVFVIDAQGKVRFKKIYPIKEVPDIQEILREVQKI
jgi:peroxiredoxin